MIEVAASVEIDRPVEQVFDFLADIGNAPRWQRGVVASKKITEGPMRVGTKFTESMHVMGMNFDAECEVTAFDRPRMITMVADGKLVHYVGTFTFEGAGSGTRLSVAAQMNFKSIWKLMSPMMGSEIKKESQAELEDIKKAIESTPEPVG